MLGRLIKGLLLALGIGGLYLITSRLQHNHQKEVLQWYRKRPSTPRQRVVVLGSGFGGLFTALYLADDLRSNPDVEIVVVDRRNFHLFTPLLTTVAAGLIDSQHVAYPVRRLERRSTFLFRESEVQGIDLDKKIVRLADGDLDYDYLVLSLGSVTNFFGMKDVERLALPFKSVRDSIRVRNEFINRFEEAAWETDPERRRRLLTFVFCGAGATGVELAAAMHDFIFDSLIEEYPGLNKDEVHLILMEAHPRILPSLSNYLSTVAHNKLLSKGIEVRTGTRVTGTITDESGNLKAVETEGGEQIPTGTLIWTAGIEANPVVASLPLEVEKGKGGSIVVDEHLAVPSHPEVYALGDNASIKDPKTGKLLPPDAKVAVRLARWVARNIDNDLNGRPREVFKYDYLGELILLGTNYAVAEVKGIRISGLPAFLLWRSFYFGRLLGIESKARVAWDYLYGLFAERDTAQLDVA